VYTTPERKLTSQYKFLLYFTLFDPCLEHLVQDDMRFARRQRTACSCHKRHIKWVDYLLAGGEQGLENEFLYCFALRDHISTTHYF
jgi:hypothetical protein